MAGWAQDEPALDSTNNSQKCLQAEEQGRGIPSVSELSGRTAALASAPFAQAREAPGDQGIS